MRRRALAVEREQVDAYVSYYNASERANADFADLAADTSSAPTWNRHVISKGGLRRTSSAHKTSRPMAAGLSGIQRRWQEYGGGHRRGKELHVGHEHRMARRAGRESRQ